MLPLRDNIQSNSRPIITYIILGLNISVFIYEISLGTHLDAFIKQFGAVPYNIFNPVGLSSYLTLFTSMFMHANLMHIIGNMLFLWIFADNIEDRVGHVVFIIFYLTCGLAGTLLHSVFTPASIIPMIGASGAISGVLGAYIILFPKARISALMPFFLFFRIVQLPSLVFLGIWFLMQFLFGISSIRATGGGVAYFAHIGGFLVGLLWALPFKFRQKKRYEYKIS
jgi:membrane associated rhomboid family serine protease